jgi:hypothetical protein
LDRIPAVSGGFSERIGLAYFPDEIVAASETAGSTAAKGKLNAPARRLLYSLLHG